MCNKHGDAFDNAPGLAELNTVTGADGTKGEAEMNVVLIYLQVAIEISFVCKFFCHGKPAKHFFCFVINHGQIDFFAKLHGIFSHFARSYLIRASIVNLQLRWIKRFTM